VPALETALIASMWRDQGAAMNFASIPWEETGPRVLLPVWRQKTRRYAELLRGVTPASLPEDLLRRYKPHQRTTSNRAAASPWARRSPAA
jgi:hypothetical protein